MTRAPSPEFWADFAAESRDSLPFAEDWFNYEAAALEHLVTAHGFDPTATTRRIMEIITTDITCNPTVFMVMQGIGLIHAAVDAMADITIAAEPNESLTEEVSSIFHSIMAAAYHRIMPAAMNRDPAIEKIVVDSDVTKH